MQQEQNWGLYQHYFAASSYLLSMVGRGLTAKMYLIWLNTNISAGGPAKLFLDMFPFCFAGNLPFEFWDSHLD